LEACFSGGDDFAGVGGPGKRLWFGVMLLDEEIDGGLQIDDAMEDAALEAAPGKFDEKPSTALSQEEDVGVKWKVKRLCRPRHSRTFGCLCAA